MAVMKYFNGHVELKGVYPMGNAEFAAQFPGVRGRRYDGVSMKVGEPVDYTPFYDREAKCWVHKYLPVEREVAYKTSPSKHVCDARCMNAKGRTMNCECACGGKNHGAGSFACD